MRGGSPLLGLIEAFGACLVVLGLGFLSLPISLIAAGVFLVLVANAPAGDPSSPSSRPPGRARLRA